MRPSLVSPSLVSRVSSLAAALACISYAQYTCAAEPVLARGTHVYGPAATNVTLHDEKGTQLKALAFGALSKVELAAGTYEVRGTLQPGESVEFPPCSGQSRIGATLAGKKVPLPENGAFVLKASNDKVDLPFTLRIKVSAYERRIACGYAPRSGLAQETSEELRDLRFDSPNGGKCHGACTPGRAIVFVPRGHDVAKPAVVLVGVHPWNGSIYTYVAYQELLAAAQDKDVVLLFPSALGNSLYTAPAETETMLALAALSKTVAVDPQRVSLWGASMGGAGATTIGFHHPDAFASVTSFFGDAKYDLTGYVRGILPTEADAHKVNPIDVIENARHIPVWLIHGEADKTSPIKQSEMLYAAMSERNYRVRFDRDKNAGHDGALVAKHVADVVTVAAGARAPQFPSRVSVKLVRAEDTGAYGVKLARSKPGDAIIDIEAVAGGKLVVHAASNIASLSLSPGALGLRADQRPTTADFKGVPMTITWAP